MPIRQAARPSYRRTYYPEATELSQAKSVEVTEGGEVTGVDITVGRPLKKYTASGRVIDETTGKPPANILINSRAVTADGQQLIGVGPDSRLDAIGNFRLEGLMPGHYVAFTAGAGSDGFSDPLGFEIIDKDITGLEVKLKRGATVTGVAVLTGADNPQADVQFSKLQINAYTAASPQFMSKSFPPIRINPDGSFRLAGVTPGRLNFSSVQGEAVKNLSIIQVECDGVPQSEGILIAQGEQNVNVKIVLGYGQGVVRGQLKIENGELPQEANVWTAIFAPGNATALRYQVVDERGRFQFEGLPTGEYEVQASVNTSNSYKWSKRASEKVFVTSGSESQITLILNLKPDKKQDR